MRQPDASLQKLCHRKGTHFIESHEAPTSKFLGVVPIESWLSPGLELRRGKEKKGGGDFVPVFRRLHCNHHHQVKLPPFEDD